MRTEASPEAQQICDGLILALLDEFRKIRETLHAEKSVGLKVFSSRNLGVWVHLLLYVLRGKVTTTSVALVNGIRSSVFTYHVRLSQILIKF